MCVKPALVSGRAAVELTSHGREGGYKDVLVVLWIFFCYIIPIPIHIHTHTYIHTYTHARTNRHSGYIPLATH